MLALHQKLRPETRGQRHRFSWRHRTRRTRVRDAQRETRTTAARFIRPRTPDRASLISPTWTTSCDRASTAFQSMPRQHPDEPQILYEPFRRCANRVHSGPEICNRQRHPARSGRSAFPRVRDPSSSAWRPLSVRPVDCVVRARLFRFRAPGRWTWARVRRSVLHGRWTRNRVRRLALRADGLGSGPGSPPLHGLDSGIGCRTGRRARATGT